MKEEGREGERHRGEERETYIGVSWRRETVEERCRDEGGREGGRKEWRERERQLY